MAQNGKRKGKPLVVAAFAAAFAALCAGLLSLMGCTGSESVSYDFGCGSIEAKGKAVAVKLQGNPTTGFEWVSDICGTAAALTQVSSGYESDARQQPVCGAGGVYTYSYEGRSAGLTTIAFSYLRPWEDNSTAYSVDVAVKTDCEGNVVATSVTSGGALLDASCGNAVASTDGFSRIEMSAFGTSAAGDKYVVEKTDSGVRFTHCEVSVGAQNSEQQLACIDGDHILYATLVALCKQSGVRSWDGYCGTDPGVLDGWTFTFDAAFNDGATVHASGSNAAPAGYADFRDALIGAFCPPNDG